MPLADKLAVAASHVAGGPSETAVVKATRTDFEKPKEKHVRALVLSTNDGAVQMPELVGAIMFRLENPNWNVVLKTLMLTHRLLRDGNSRFLEELKYRPKVFQLDRFQDVATIDGQRNSELVRKYALYLEERVNVHKSIKVDFTKKPNACKDLSVDDMFVKIPKLQSLVNALLNCRVPRPDFNNPLVMFAFQYLLKDSYALFTCLSAGMVNLIERFFDMSKSDAQRAFDMYQLYVKETDSTIAMYDMCRGFATNLPEVSKLVTPPSLTTAMEEHLSELKGTKSKKTKKEKEKKNKEAKSAAKAAVAKQQTQSADLFDIDWDSPAATQAVATANTTTTNTADPFGGDPFAASSASSSSAQSPFGGGGGAAPAAANGGGNAMFDPFASTTAAPTAGLSADDKMRRILMVQQMSSSAGGVPGALDSTSTPLTPLQPAPAQAAPVTGIPAFNPFPQQPLNVMQPQQPQAFQQQPLQPQQQQQQQQPFGFGAQPQQQQQGWSQNPFM